MEAVVQFLALLLTALVLTGLPARGADQQDFNTCRMANNADTAISSCTRVIDDLSLRPDVRAEAYWYRGEANDDTGQKERAIADYTEVIRLEPDATRAYFARGRIYQSRGDHDRAIADFSAFVRLDPKAFGAFHARGNSHREKGDLDRAIADYNEAIRILPNLSSAYHDRGVAYRLKGDREHAIADFRQVVRISPLASARSLDELHALGASAPKTEQEAFKQGVLELLK
jgi:tetratricopeptide (TPR) repeat protein